MKGIFFKNFNTALWENNTNPRLISAALLSLNESSPYKTTIDKLFVVLCGTSIQSMTRESSFKCLMQSFLSNYLKHKNIGDISISVEVTALALSSSHEELKTIDTIFYSLCRQPLSKMLSA